MYSYDCFFFGPGSHIMKACKVHFNDWWSQFSNTRTHTQSCLACFSQWLVVVWRFALNICVKSRNCWWSQRFQSHNAPSEWIERLALCDCGRLVGSALQDSCAGLINGLGFIQCVYLCLYRSRAVTVTSGHHTLTGLMVSPWVCWMKHSGGGEEACVIRLISGHVRYTNPSL